MKRRSCHDTILGGGTYVRTTFDLSTKKKKKKKKRMKKGGGKVRNRRSKRGRFLDPLVPLGQWLEKKMSKPGRRLEGKRGT